VVHIARSREKSSVQKEPLTLLLPLPRRPCRLSCCRYLPKPAFRDLSTPSTLNSPHRGTSHDKSSDAPPTHSPTGGVGGAACAGLAHHSVASACRRCRLRVHHAGCAGPQHGRGGRHRRWAVARGCAGGRSANPPARFPCRSHRIRRCGGLEAKSCRPETGLNCTANLDRAVSTQKESSSLVHHPSLLPSSAPQQPPPCQLHRTVSDTTSKRFTRFAASLRTDISPQRKEARPLSHALTSD
jgi:hypothetical protein